MIAIAVPGRGCCTSCGGYYDPPIDCGRVRPEKFLLPFYMGLVRVNQSPCVLWSGEGGRLCCAWGAGVLAWTAACPHSS